MGKLFTEFSSFITTNGIDFDVIQQIVNSLPGETRFIRFGHVMGRNILRLDMENDNFVDGTEIVACYKSHFNATTGVGTAIFAGITVIDPPALAIGQPFNGVSYNFIPPVGMGNLGVASGSNGGSGGSITVTLPTSYQTVYPSVVIKSDGASWSVVGEAAACSCGADSVGGVHSSYCDKA